MLLNEFNLRALNVSADSVLPVGKNLCIEGKELNFTITDFQSGFGSGRKTVISGSVSLNDENHTSTTFEHSDIEAIRRKVSKLLGLKTSARKPRAPKEQPVIVKTEVDKLRDALAVARRLPQEWITINAAAVWKAYKRAKQVDEAPNQLSKLTTLAAEKQVRAYELLKQAGLL